MICDCNLLRKHGACCKLGMLQYFHLFCHVNVSGFGCDEEKTQKENIFGFCFVFTFYFCYLTFLRCHRFLMYSKKSLLLCIATPRDVQK